MGLFSSKSSSSAKTTYTDNSNTESQAVGDMLASEKNNIAGGDIYNTGLSEDMVSGIFSSINDFYSNALNFVTGSIGKQSDNVQQVTSALSGAYNSEQATISSFKTYALYGLLGFIAWAYFSKR